MTALAILVGALLVVLNGTFVALEFGLLGAMKSAIKQKLAKDRKKVKAMAKANEGGGGGADYLALEAQGRKVGRAHYAGKYPAAEGPAPAGRSGQENKHTRG